MTLRLEAAGRSQGGELHLAPMTLELAPGSLNVLLGPTLAGKTSFLRLLAGLDRPTTGRLLVKGEDAARIPVRRRSVAMVYQQFINYPSFTVYENIASPLRRAGVERELLDRKVREAAELLHIEGLLDRLPAELSGGQQQRTALARALVKEAELLLLDEPLVNLDYKLREELREELRQIFARKQAIVVYATTEPLEALTLGGEVLVLHQGRLLQRGPVLQVFHRPATLEVGRIFSDPPINLARAEFGPAEVRLEGELSFSRRGHLAGVAPGSYHLGVRANHLRIARRDEEDLSIPMQVELAEINGSETFIHLRHGAIAWVVQSEGLHSFRLGDRLEVFLSPRQLLVFDAEGRLAAAPESA